MTKSAAAARGAGREGPSAHGGRRQRRRWQRGGAGASCRMQMVADGRELAPLGAFGRNWSDSGLLVFNSQL